MDFNAILSSAGEQLPEALKALFPEGLDNIPQLLGGFLEQAAAMVPVSFDYA